MKVRIKFSKHGKMIYIGHLDLMRYFQKSMRRAYIPIKYSEGFSPHQIMSFASPLGIGIESDAEYFDIELEPNAKIIPYEAIMRLNCVMVPGIQILDWKELPDDAKKSMSILTSADYEVQIDQYDLSLIPEEMKSLIYEIHPIQGGLFMRVAQGSTANLKPEDLISVITGSDDANKLEARAKCLITRKEMYGPDGLTL